MAQIAPSTEEVADYGLLQAATFRNDTNAVQTLLSKGANPNLRDGRQRTLVHIAAHASAADTLRMLVMAGADINAMEFQDYDAITIAAVANDVQMLKLALELGGNPTTVTSPYEGTALIAAAHLGHVEVVKILIEAGSPLDHINNLHWTALIEAVVLGDGGANHTEIVRMLVSAGADTDITDRNGVSPLGHANSLGYEKMIAILR
jgi:ankyrin repeat protein